MGHDKLRKFAENETFSCLLQPSAQELLADGYFALRDHAVKGHWGERFERADAPLVLELGCGKGEYTIDLALREPGKNYVGVDIKGARLWKGAKYATQHSLGNVGFLRTRIEFITAFFAPDEVSEIWLTFSDPQVRSENSRLTSPIFLERYSRFLAPGGLVHLKTDSQFLYQYTLAVCRANSLEIVAQSEDLYAEAERFDACLTQVQTFYEQMFREQGYAIKYLCFRLREGPGAGDRSRPWLREREGPAPSGVGGMSGAKSPRPGASGVGQGSGTDTDAGRFVSPTDFDPDYWRSVEGHRTLFGRDTAETRRQKLKNK
ncbi:MAG: tRNA (guanosine(46)-N7)-methyltransferase TrmB [Bacteroidales bacterium]|nr:tRNA (guanosine(46)-N7)-methyltransferase TrmB [Bacteroidales bacterium]